MKNCLTLLALLSVAFAHAQNNYTTVNTTDKNLNTAFDNTTKKVGFPRFYRLDKDDANPVIPYIYDWSNGFSGTYAVVQKEGKWGVIDTLGHNLIPIAYEQVTNFKDNMAVVKNNGKFGIVNTKGATQVPLEYDFISPLFINGNMVEAVKDGRWGIITTQNKIVVPLQYRFGRMDDGFYVGISEGNKRNWFLMPSGKQLMMENVAEITEVGTGYYKIRLNDKTVGIINDKEEIIIPFDANKISPLIKSKGLVNIRKEKLTGVFNLNTKQWVLEPKYRNIFEREDKIINAVTRQDTEETPGEDAFFDLDGKQLFGKTFEDSDLLSGARDLIFAKYQGKWGVLDTTGKVLIPFEIDSKDDISGSGTGYLIAKKESGWGVVDLTGKTIVPFQYYETSGYGNPFGFYHSDQYFAVQKDGKRGIIGKNGETLIPFNYDEYNLYLDQDRALRDVTYNIASGLRNGKVTVTDMSTNTKVIEFEPNNDSATINVSVRSSRTADALYPYLKDLEKKGYKDGILLLNDKKSFFSKDFNYEYYYAPSNSFTVFKEKNQYGLADGNGNPITDFGYETIQDAYEGMFFAVRNNKAGVIDGYGKTVVPFKYDVERDAFGGIANSIHFYNAMTDDLKINGKKVLLNTKGQEVDTGKFGISGASYFSSIFGKVPVVEAYSKDKMKIMVHNKIYECGANLKFFGGLAYQEPSFENARTFYFTDGIEAVKYNGLYGFMDYDGNMAIPAQYEMASDFTVFGYAYVKKDGEYFIIDGKGNRMPMTDLYLEIYKESLAGK